MGVFRVFKLGHDRLDWTVEVVCMLVGFEFRVGHNGVGSVYSGLKSRVFFFFFFILVATWWRF